MANAPKSIVPYQEELKFLIPVAERVRAVYLQQNRPYISARESKGLPFGWEGLSYFANNIRTVSKGGDVGRKIKETVGPLQGMELGLELVPDGATAMLYFPSTGRHYLFDLDEPNGFTMVRRRHGLSRVLGDFERKTLEMTDLSEIFANQKLAETLVK